MLTIPIFKVDAFTEKVFSGNPAAVCPLETWIDTSLMQAIAEENNLSETAFFVKEQKGYGLKWFTPEAEIDLCGHATLASAFVLFNLLGHEGDTVDFFTKSGKLSVSRKGVELTLNFPSIPLRKIDLPEGILPSLSIIPLETYGGLNTIMAVFDNEDEVLSVRPDFNEIRKLDCLILYITAPGKSVDFVSRVFAPALGINEDPVTGSAHCSLTPYWSQRLSKTTLTATQVSKRKGDLVCANLGERTGISGKAVLFSKGEIILDI